MKILEEELAASALHAAAAQPTAQLKPEPAQGDDLLGLDIIKNVPLLPSNAIDDLLTRFNLVQVIRLLGRLAPIAAPPKVREALGWSKEALTRHKLAKRNLRTVNLLSTLEFYKNILRFGFLALCKASQAAHPPRSKDRVLD